MATRMRPVTRTLQSILHILLEELNIPLAPKKTFHPTQCLEFMDLTLNSVRMAASLPDDKLYNAHLMLACWSSTDPVICVTFNPSLGLYTSPVRLSPQVVPSCNRLSISLKGFATLGISFPQPRIQEGHSQFSLDYWNVVTLFLPPFTEPSHKFTFFLQ